MKILLAEDDRKTAAYLRKGLGECGFVVDVAENGVDGLHLATTGEHDAIILDVMMPQRNGWDVLSTLRQSGRQTPVMFLTACDSVAEKVKGLQLGADDYLVKPFSFSELQARLQSLLRRGQSRQSEIIAIADLRIDIVRQKVSRAGRRVDLTAKEFRLLSLLARRAGEVLPRTLIAEQVWDMNFDSDTNVVDVAVRRLRSKVDDPFESRLIHSVRGVGYVLDEERGRAS